MAEPGSLFQPYNKSKSPTCRESNSGDVLDVAAARRPLHNMRCVNVDFPPWMVESLDREADRLGVTRRSLIKIWIAERLERLAS
jgi:hypothetical protein